MSRARWISLGVLLLLLALLPFVPHGGGDPGAIRNAGEPGQAGRSAQSQPLTAGYGRVTPAFRRTIDRVVAADAAADRSTPETAPGTVIDDVVRCAVFEGQRYCLGTGWTDRTQAQLRAGLTALASRPTARASTADATGDLSALDAVRQAARLSPADRAAAQRVELTRAARSVAKVWLLRHQVQGVPLPTDFYARHPEVRTTDAATSALTPGPTLGRGKVKHWRDYPRKGVVLNPKHVAQQHRTYWCGPTSMQMITWGWSHRRRSQAHWAGKLKTTTSGSSITSMVQVVNRYTGWDKQSYAGPYIVLDIRDWTFRKWMVLMARHLVDYRAPVILHPVLFTQFYPYLDHDGSGHFQVGRGYRKRHGKTPLLGFFEPWNQQRFHPDEPFIDRVQWRNGYQSYRANRAHFQHNLGV